MVPFGQNEKDRAFDPFTHMMFGAKLPPQRPPQPFYQNGALPSGMEPGQPGQPSLLKPFLDKDGHVDIGKVMNGANQLVSVINQTAPAIKQLSPLLKFLKRP